MLISTGLKIHTRATINMPPDIGRTMLAILDLIPDTGLEYGMYLKGTWNADKCCVDIVPGEIYFPKQEVTGVTIKFTEDPPDPSWNVVIHRHPSSCRKFSSTDVNSINEEFLASLLFIPPWEFPDAIVNVPLAPGVKLQIPADVKPLGGMYDVPEPLRNAVRARLTRANQRPVGEPEKLGRSTVQRLGDDTPDRPRLPPRFPPRRGPVQPPTDDILAMAGFPSLEGMEPADADHIPDPDTQIRV